MLLKIFIKIRPIQKSAKIAGRAMAPPAVSAVALATGLGSTLFIRVPVNFGSVPVPAWNDNFV